MNRMNMKREWETMIMEWCKCKLNRQWSSSNLTSWRSISISQKSVKWHGMWQPVGIFIYIFLEPCNGHWPSHRRIKSTLPVSPSPWGYCGSLELSCSELWRKAVYCHSKGVGPKAARLQGWPTVTLVQVPSSVKLRWGVVPPPTTH